ncbi:MAG: hypothetical protein IPL53_19175 [Ignavibacteria bacterium]|nr:hypothetical protein [Ignavibacteria bacterium]
MELLYTFTVGLGKGSEDLFLNYAVPFEIKSLFILAIAKLFEFAFDELEIQYLGIAGDTDILSETQTLKEIKIEFLNFPDQAKINEINGVINNWNETIKSMKDEKFEKSLDNILKITGRS